MENKEETSKEIDRLLSLSKDELDKNIVESFNDYLTQLNKLYVKINCYKFLALFTLIVTIPLFILSYEFFTVGSVILSLFFYKKVKDTKVKIDLILLFVDMFYINVDETFG